MGKAALINSHNAGRALGPQRARDFEHPAFSANMDFRLSGELSGGSGPADGPGMPRMHPADRLARVRKLAEA